MFQIVYCILEIFKYTKLQRAQTFTLWIIYIYTVLKIRVKEQFFKKKKFLRVKNTLIKNLLYIFMPIKRLNIFLDF